MPPLAESAVDSAATAVVLVREAAGYDSAEIAGIHIRAWRDGYRGIISDEILAAMSLAERTGRWQGILGDADGRHRTIVAEGQTSVIHGFCSYTPLGMDEDSREGQGEISALYVDPSRWRAGVGRALMDEALVRLRAAGCEEVTLWCFEDNARALAFYTKLGFVPDEAREVKYEKQNVRLRMRL